MSKPAIVLLAVLTGLLSIFYLDILLEYLTAVILIKNKAGISFSGIAFSLILPQPGKNEFYNYAVTFITPFLGSVIQIEASMLWLKKTTSDKARSFILIFQIINIGFILFSIFAIIISVLLKINLSGNWLMLMGTDAGAENHVLIFMALTTVLLLTYINILTKRLKNSIPVISRK